MKCFLSHNSNDKPIAKKIGAALMRHDVDPWLDKWDIFAGESLTTKIGDAIDQCDSFIILMSPNSMTSKWVKEELRIALQRRIHDEKFKLIPVLLEDCDIHPFLRDYVYIDWRKGESIGIESLLRAIKQISEKPDYSSLLPNLSIRKVVQTVRLYGGQRDALFSEHFQVIPTRDVALINRNLFFSGELIEISSDVFEVERFFVTPTYEKLELRPRTEIKPNEEFCFTLNYRINGCFSKPEELWFYAIESPTDLVRLEFDFEDSQAPALLAVKYRQGQSLYDESVQPRQAGNKFVWEKAFPGYKDSYEFHLKWNEVEGNLTPLHT